MLKFYQGKMLILGISDIHGDTGNLEKIAGKVGKVDLVLVSGDLTHFGGKTQAQQVINQVKKYFPEVLAVSGNCDEREVEDYLSGEGISLNGKAKIIRGIGFLGAGFSLPCPVYTPGEVTEEHFQKTLESASCLLPEKIPFLLVTHHPAYGTKMDFVRSGRHVGSQAIRKFIEEKKPWVCLSGHIHEATGQDILGSTILVNPGPLRLGGFVLLEVDAQGYRIKEQSFPGS